MARKQQRSGESTDVYFDTRTKAVLTQTSSNSMANVKEQLASVREVWPHGKKEDILLILQHFDGDVPKTIQAIMEGVADDILKEWNVPNRRKTGNNVGKKNKKKKPNRQTTPSSQEDGPTVTNGVQEEHIPNNNNIDKDKPIVAKMEPVNSAKDAGGEQGTSTKPKPMSSASTTDSKPAQQHDRTLGSPKQQRQPRQHQGKANGPPAPRGNNNLPSKSQEAGDRPPPAQSQGKPAQSQGKPAQSQGKPVRQQHQGPAKPGQQTGNKPSARPTPDHSRPDGHSGQKAGHVAPPIHGQSADGKRERNVSESSSVTDGSRSRKTASTLDKSTKDLQRTVVSLTRHKNLLAEEIEKAEKRLKKACDDARTSLSTREEDLMRLIQEVKRHATSLLEERQHKAFELKQEISRAASKSDHDLLELRADIKHFVSERKIDEEIGRSSRFTGDVDSMQQAIKSFGEVLVVKNVYSPRRSSLTSLTSMDSLSRPTSISDDRSGLPSTRASPLEGAVKGSQDAASAPTTPVSPTSPDADMNSEVVKMVAKMQRSMQGPRNRGPRNPRQQGDNNRQGPQGNGPRQDRQDQRGNRGRQEGATSPHKRADDKPRNDVNHQGRRNERNDRPRNDRPRSDRDRGGDGQRGKEEPRSKDRNIRRREQYRRRHEPGTDSKQEEGDVKKDTSSVPRPNSIPLPQNGPSLANVDKKPAQQNHNHTNSPGKPKTPTKMKDQAQVNSIPLVNGNANNISAESSPTEALPQRKPREGRNRNKVEDVVKEVTSMNGMLNGNASPVMLNGES